jgi:hypothetical protein
MQVMDPMIWTLEVQREIGRMMMFQNMMKYLQRLHHIKVVPSVVMHYV